MKLFTKTDDSHLYRCYIDHWDNFFSNKVQNFTYTVGIPHKPAIMHHAGKSRHLTNIIDNYAIRKYYPIEVVLDRFFPLRNLA